MCDKDHCAESVAEYEARGLVTRRQFGVLPHWHWQPVTERSRPSTIHGVSFMGASVGGHPTRGQPMMPSSVPHTSS